MKPPDLAGGEGDPSGAGHLHEMGGGELGPDDLGAGLPRRSARPPWAPPPAGPPWPAVTRGDHQVEQEQEGLVVGEDVALVVDQGDVLAAGVDDRPQVGPRRPHQVGDPGGAAARSVEGQHAAVAA